MTRELRRVGVALASWIEMEVTLALQRNSPGKINSAAPLRVSVTAICSRVVTRFTFLPFGRFGEPIARPSLAHEVD